MGSRLPQYGEALLGRMPIIGFIHGGLKQVFETVLFRGRRTPSRKWRRTASTVPWDLVLVFIAADARGPIGDVVTGGGAGGGAGGDEPVTVFLPTSPNPTNGFLIFVKKSELVVLDMTVEDALKMVISAGLLSPEMLDRTTKDKTSRAARRLRKFTAPPAA